MTAGASMKLNIRQKGVHESYLVPQLGKLSPASGNGERKLKISLDGKLKYLGVFQEGSVVQ